MGDKTYYGPGVNFKIDTTKPVTVVTQFITSDGTDTGDLIEMRRFYVQGGVKIQNSKVFFKNTLRNSTAVALCIIFLKF